MIKKKNNPEKKTRKYYRLKELDPGDLSDLKAGDYNIWLRSGKYDAPSVTVNISDEEAIGDYLRCIHLHGVKPVIVENEKGYKDLHFYAEGDLPF